MRLNKLALVFFTFGRNTDSLDKARGELYDLFGRLLIADLSEDLTRFDCVTLEAAELHLHVFLVVLARVAILGTIRDWFHGEADLVTELHDTSLFDWLIAINFARILFLLELARIDGLKTLALKSAIQVLVTVSIAKSVGFVVFAQVRGQFVVAFAELGLVVVVIVPTKTALTVLVELTDFDPCLAAIKAKGHFRVRVDDHAVLYRKSVLGHFFGSLLLFVDRETEVFARGRLDFDHVTVLGDFEDLIASMVLLHQDSESWSLVAAVFG